MAETLWIQAYKHCQNNFHKLKSVWKGKLGDLSVFEHDMVLGAKRVGLSISQWLVSIVQAGGDGGVGDIFLAHFEPLSANWAPFKNQTLPGYCSWPCPSLWEHQCPVD